MEGTEVAPSAWTYRRPMTGEWGYTKQAGYEFQNVFAEQALRGFVPTREAETSLWEMGFVKYPGDIAKLLLEMENLNMHARVTGIVWRQMIADQIPEDALRRLSLWEYVDDGEWLAAVRTITLAEEEVKELKSLWGCGPSDLTKGEKQSFEDWRPPVTAKWAKSRTRLKKRLIIRLGRLGKGRWKRKGRWHGRGRWKTRCGPKPLRALIKTLSTNDRKTTNAHGTVWTIALGGSVASSYK